MHSFLSRLIALAVLATPLVAQDDTRPTVAVLPFVNSAIGTANAELAPLSKGIADLLITDLGMNPGIRMVERENIQQLLDEQRLAQDGRVDDATAARIGKLLGAKHMVTGSFITDRTGQMVVTLKAIDSETGRISWTHKDQGKTDDFLALVAKVASAANTGLKLPALTSQAKAATAERTAEQKRIPFQAVMLYSRALSAQDAGQKEEAIQLFTQTIERFPDFDDARTARAKLTGGGAAR
ncbi:MAG: CsgG/HfaB family protein [Gemmatimonadota bacterium]